MAEMAFDVVVIGAGIAGASAAALIAAGGAKVAVLEAESQPGHHSTGRSAAVFSETYGSLQVRALSRASREFLFHPPASFCEHALVGPRGCLHIARDGQRAALEAFLALPDVAANAEAVGAERALRLSPILKKGYAVGAAYERGAMDVDVAALHQGYLRQARAAGAVLVTQARVVALERRSGLWRARTAVGLFAAPVIVDAAGAWADSVAALAGLAPLGIVPRRRTAVLVDGPPEMDLSAMPNTIDIDEQFYFKPESGRIFLSPADETPSPPCDAQPEEEDVAVGIARVEAATTLQVRRVARKWAGLRSFAPDRSPVIGFDGHAEGFFWLAGQGGYGIQTAPAAGALAAALIRSGGVPDELAAFGVVAQALSPRRFEPAARPPASGPGRR